MKQFGFPFYSSLYNRIASINRGMLARWKNVAVATGTVLLIILAYENWDIIIIINVWYNCVCLSM